MLSNLPPGLSESQIPGCTPDDHAIDNAIEHKLCEACKWCDNDSEIEPCNECYINSSLGDNFEAESDEALILERLKDKAESSQDGHRDE